ncbi:hypothetical protein E0H82_05155 [Acinetobacter sp. ANC 4910]|nr:hypothetical protein E0H82_05155 [Acinetobacter sp. ANC 4910]
MTKAAMSVLDRQGHIHDMLSFRMIITSIMPFILMGNLNATTIMMTEKMAAQICG